MKKFDRIKTIQLALLIILTLIALTAILRSRELFTLIATNGSVKLISLLLWLALGVSFMFLLYDFNSYSDMKRENLELDNAVHSDTLTGLANRYSVDAYIGRFINKPLPQDMGVITIEIINLGEINHTHGHSGGDLVIQAFSSILLEASSGACFVGRNGGNKFVAIFRDCSNARMAKFMAYVRKHVEDRNESHPDAAIKYSSGIAFDEGPEIDSVTELVALSDRRAWENSGRIW
ncbi:MAG: GGDEF domain-containing protein [Clostridiales bacterium]|nr:GGDEF domain-containing protein [Clostridiales bacterium]